MDFFAGARIGGKAWIETSNVTSHAGLGVQMCTASGRVRVKAMKAGYPAHLCGELAVGDTLLEINGKTLPADIGEALKRTMGAFSEGSPGAVIQILSEGLDCVRRYVNLIKVEAPCFEGSVGKVDLGILLGQ